MMSMMTRAVLLLAFAACIGSAAAAPAGRPPIAAPAVGTNAAVAPEAAASAVSLSARKVYEQARTQLVQIRTVLKGRASQTSVGSGFVVSKEGHILTNFHVVSQVALEPETHDLVYVTADGHEARLQILMLDVLHDLALVKATPEPVAGDAAVSTAASASAASSASATAVAAQSTVQFDALPFRPASLALSQGERMYSLGNPLDVGFAVIEGNYNGLVERSFYPQIFFSGSLSAGMSGGPALDQEGRVIGVNVARRVDGEQVSFLVPASFAVALLERGRNAKPITAPVYAEITRQLMLHQQTLTDRFIAQGWKSDTHPRYHVPVPADRFMRCWGTSQLSKTGGLDFERSDCVMDTRIFVGAFTTGAIALRHESYDGRKLGTLRFAQTYSSSFRNEAFGRLRGEDMTKPQCHEDFVERQGLPLRAVVCMRAYKKLTGLFDVAALVVTLDQNQAGVQGRFDAQGLSFPNAVKMAQHYIDGFALLPSTRTSTPTSTSTPTNSSGAKPGPQSSARPDMRSITQPTSQSNPSSSKLTTARAP